MGGGPTQTTNQKQSGSGSEAGTSSSLINALGNTSSSNSLNGSTGPYGASAPMLNNILQVAAGVPLNSTPTPQQSAAISGLGGAASNVAGLNPQIMSAAGNMLQGGGVGANNGYVTGALDKSNAALSPYLGTSFLDPMTNPYLAPALTGLQDQITNANKDAFAASGRFGASGDFTKANAMGLSQGMAPLLLNQFNTNAGLQQGAANSMVGNNISGAGQLDTSAVNRNNVISGAPSFASNTYNPYMTALQSANLAVQQPWTNLGYASQFLTPLAGLGSTSTQAGTTTGLTNNISNSLTNSSSQSKNNSTGTSTTQQQSNPFQTALGGILGLLSIA